MKNRVLNSFKRQLGFALFIVMASIYYVAMNTSGGKTLPLLDIAVISLFSLYAAFVLSLNIYSLVKKLLAIKHDGP